MADSLSEIVATPMQSDLLGRWPLDAGTNIFDRSLNGYDGTFSAPVEVAGLPTIESSITLTCWARGDFLISRPSQFSLSPTTVEFGASRTLAFAPVSTPAEWHHYATDYNIDSGEVRLFIDGALQTNALFAAGPLAASTSPLSLDGNLSDVRLYTQTL